MQINVNVHPKTSTKTYAIFDSLYALKKIRNQILYSRKFVFLAIDSEDWRSSIVSEAGYITWGDMHKLHDHDQKNYAHLRKAPRLSYQGLHPDNEKQFVNLTSAFFLETTIAACLGLFPDCIDITFFLKLINVLWTSINSRSWYSSNLLANAIIPQDNK